MKLLSHISKKENEAAFRLAILVAGLSLGLRLLYMGFICLMPEEAYYWQYSRHLDLSYLDHPPMVALTIRFFATIFGNTEFGVRAGAVAWWCVAAIFVYRFSADVFDKKTGCAALVLFSVLPYFFGSGLFMTPDAPLVAFWAASLSFFHSALVKNSGRAWWGAGFCLGLGMLSKYSIALLGIAALIYMAAHRAARREFLSWRPYAAACAGLLLFCPVILWNYEHNWASFAFQSADRLSKPMEFSLHILLAHLLAIITPVGIYVLYVCLFKRSRDEKRLELRKTADVLLPEDSSSCEFLVLFTAVPYLVFAFFSLTHEVKINWSGPVFLAFLPVLARSVSLVSSAGLVAGIRAGWDWTAIVLLCSYFLILQYLSFGIPGIGYPGNMYKFMTGRSVAAELEKRAGEMERTTKHRPVIVGMDKHYLASQIAFYLSRSGVKSEETAGRNLFGLESLMYRFWTDPKSYDGRDMLLVSKTPSDLNPALLRPFFKSVGAPREILNSRNGKVVGRFYYSVGLTYDAAALQERRPEK